MAIEQDVFVSARTVPVAGGEGASLSLTNAQAQYKPFSCPLDQIRQAYEVSSVIGSGVIYLASRILNRTRSNGKYSSVPNNIGISERTTF
jgi:hypothetical protein